MKFPSMKANILKNTVAQIRNINGVLRSEVEFGDLLFIFTENSLYSLYALDSHHFLVSGGWFDKKGLSPLKISISGCSWGGSTIWIDSLAVCGLSLEFNNGIITSPVKNIILLHGNNKN